MQLGLGRRLAVIALLWMRSYAEVVTPSPPENTSRVGSAPVLSWAPGTNSLLSNGGFEAGLEGWTTSARASVVKSGLQVKALEGTNLLRMDFGRISRRIAVPAGNFGTALTFANSYTSLPALNARLLNDENEVVQERDWGMQGSVATLSGWKRWLFDLTPFAGKNVTIEITGQTGDFGVYGYYDDFQLVAAEEGTEYDVYLSAPRSSVLNLLGRTRGTSWPLTNLVQNAPYQWRVDEVVNGVTNQGPVWQFFTGTGSTVSYLDVSEPAARVCAERPLEITVLKKDRLGLPSNTGGLPQMAAFADDLKAPSVVISEISWGAQDGIEFMNVSTGRVSLAKWRIDAYGRFATGLDAFSGQRITLPEGTVLEPGQVLTIAETSGTVRLPPVDWADILPRLIATVILRDAASNVVDSVFVNAPPSPTTDEARLIVWEYDWIGARIEVAAEGTTLQRVGARDSNRAEDWVSAPGSFGEPNAGMAAVFERGPGRLALASAQSTNINGVFRVAVEFSGPATNVILAAKLAGAVGFTGPFDVVGSERCMTLMAPIEILEAAPPAKLKIVLGGAEARDVVARLRSSDPRRLPLPDMVTVPAGATEIEVDLESPNDELLEGSTVVTVTAEADAYSAADASMVVQDEEKAALSIIAPSTVREGTFGEIYVVSSRAPDKDIFVKLESSDGEIFPADGATIKAGQTQTMLLVPAPENDAFQSTHEVSVRASFEDWTPASADFEYVDDEVPEVIVAGLDSIREGETLTQPYVGLNLTATHDVTLTLKSSDPNLVITPTQVTIPAYTTGANFEARVLNDDLKTGRRTMTITAEGIVSGAHTVIVEDNDPDWLRVEAPEGPWAKDRNIPVTVTAMTIDGSPVAIGGVTNLTFVVKEGETPLASSATPGVGYDWTDVQIHQTSAGARIFATAGDLKGQTELATPVWSYVATNSGRAVYDAVRDDFIVAEFDRPLRIFNGDTGEDRLGGAGMNGAHFVAMSDDQKSVFAIGENTKRLLKIDLDTLATEDWTAGALAGETRLILSAAALPGRPELLAVWANGETNGLFMVLSNGVRIAEYAAPQNWNPWLAVAADGRKIFVNFAAETSMITLDENFAVQSFEGTTQWNGNANPFHADGIPIFEDGLLVNGHGLAFDPEVSGFYTAGQTYSQNAATALDKETGRIALAHRNNAGQTELRILAPVTHAPIGTARLNVSNEGELFVAPAGKRGWMVFANGMFHVVTDPAPPSVEKSEIAVSAEASAHPTSSRALRVKVTVRNSGDAAENVTLGFAMPENIMVVGTPAGVAALTNGVLRHGYALGEIPGNSAREFQFDFTRPDPGSIALSAFAGSGKSEENLADNRATARGDVTFETLPPAPLVAVSLDRETAMTTITFPTTAGWLYKLQWNQGDGAPWSEYPMEWRGAGADGMFQVHVEEGLPVLFFRVIAVP